MAGVLGLGAVISIHEYLTRGADFGGKSLSATWGSLLGLWALWTLIFYRSSRNRSRDRCDLAAVPLSAERKHSGIADCRAHAHRGALAGLLLRRVYTFLGIAFGVAVMLFSYGPGVFFRLRGAVEEVASSKG